MSEVRVHEQSESLDRLIQALKKVRIGGGLTEAAVAKRPEITRMAVILNEADRLGRSAEEVAVAMLRALVRQLEPIKFRPALSTAYGVDYSGPPGSLMRRRGFYSSTGGPVDVSTIIDHENRAIETVARRLRQLDDVVAELGDYLDPSAHELIPPRVLAPTSPDEPHNPDEFTMLHQETWYVLDANRMATHCLNSALAEANVSGVTGVTSPHIAPPGTHVARYEVLIGGVVGRTFQSSVPTAVPLTNIEFPRPLRKGERHYVLYIMHYVHDERREHHGIAVKPASPTLSARLRVQFDPSATPVQIRWFAALAEHLPAASGRKQTLTLNKGNYVERVLRSPRQDTAYAIEWAWE